MKRLTGIIFLMVLFSANNSLGQTNKLVTIIDSIIKINEVQGRLVGFPGAESKNFKNFKQLKEMATIDELVQLTDHKNATVACYASWGLADKSYSNLKTIFAKFILKDREVKTFNECVKSQDNISAELYLRYWKNIDDTNKATDKILIQLDSIILFRKKTDLLLLNIALENRVYQEPYKNQIAILAFDKGHKEAICYLCNWYKAEYTEKFKTALLKYLSKEEFKNISESDYCDEFEKLFKLNNPEIRKARNCKMIADRF